VVGLLQSPTGRARNLGAQATPPPSTARSARLAEHRRAHRPQGIESSERLGRRRWVIEPTMPWLTVSRDTTQLEKDGQRCIVYVSGAGSLVLRPHAGLDITTAYPELSAQAGALSGLPAALDG
jgi:hypothetical protein